MPILSLPLGPDGAVIDLSVGVSEPKRQALIRANEPVPTPIQIRALIDPGASVTCIEDSAIQPLGLVPSGAVSIATSSTGTAPVLCNQYDVSLRLMHPVLAGVFHLVPIVACKPLSPNFRALLGRDLLAHCLFVYDGQ